MGTRHTPMLERRRLIEGWRRSGLNAGAYAIQCGIVPETFRRWIRALASSSSRMERPIRNAKESPPRFLEVQVQALAPSPDRVASVFIVQIDQRVLRFAEPPPPAWFAALLGELRPC